MHAEVLTTGMRTPRAQLLLALPVCLGLDNGVGLVPPMGWGTWNLFGCYGMNWTEVDIMEMADAMISSGMRDAGYTYVNLDAGWAAGRDSHGKPIASPNKFPSGIANLSAYLHSRGLKFGIYRDRRVDEGFEQQDADQYAEWGVDWVKNDGYGAHTNMSSHAVYARFRDFANKTGRPMALNIKFDIEPEGFAGGPLLANSFRIGRDIRPVWADVERLADIGVSVAARVSRPGAFADLDALEVGVEGRVYDCSPDPGHSGPIPWNLAFCPGPRATRTCVDTGQRATMTVVEQRTHIALWAMLASPLIAAADLRTMSNVTRAMLTAPGPIAVSQDPMAVPARRVRVEPAGLFETWARPLSNGSFAVLLYNRSATSCLPHDDHEVHIDPTPQVFFSSLGFRGDAAVVDLWSGEYLGMHTDNWPPAYSPASSWLPTGAHGSRLVRVDPLPASHWTQADEVKVGDMADYDCPIWGCATQRKVYAAWRATL